MFNTPTVLKNPAYSAAGVAEDFLLPADAKLRIPGSAVALADSNAEEEQPYRLSGVLRGAVTQPGVSPYEISVPDWAANIAPATSRPDARGKPEEIEPEPLEPPPPHPEQLRAEWEAEWQARMEQAVEQARQEGHQQGYTAALEEMQPALEAQHQALRADLAQLHDTVDAFFLQCEPLLVNLAFGVAETILEGPLPDECKDIVARSLFEAVERLAGHPPIEIALHPVDYLRLQESGVVEQLNALHSGIRWEPNSNLAERNWVAQSPSATIRRLQEELLATLRDRLGVLAAATR